MPGSTDNAPIGALTDDALADIATRDNMAPPILGDRSPAADRRALLAHIRALESREAPTDEAFRSLAMQAERAERRLAVARSQAQIATQALRLVVELEPEGGTPWL